MTEISSVLTGEVGVFGSPLVFFLVAQVMVTRKVTLGLDYLDGWYGWDDQISPWAWEMARLLSKEGILPGEFLYVLSREDVRALGFPPGDLVFQRGRYEIHFYRRWGESDWTMRILLASPRSYSTSYRFQVPGWVRLTREHDPLVQDMSRRRAGESDPTAAETS